MAYEMTPLVLRCTYPFPKEGLKCPACDRIQKKPSLFNLHARNVHHTLTTETPTTCSACGRLCPSYKAASAHYSRAHADPSKKKSKPPSPPSTQSLSPPSSASTQDASQPSAMKQPSQTAEAANPRPHSLPLSLKRRQPLSPTNTPLLLSPKESTQELMKRFLQDIPPPLQPTAPTSSAGACSPTKDTPTLNSPNRPVATPAPPIPVQSRRSIIPSPSSRLEDFIHSIRHGGSPPTATMQPQAVSPPPHLESIPSSTADTFNRGLALLKEALLPHDASSSDNETSLDADSSQTPPRVHYQAPVHKPHTLTQLPTCHPPNLRPPPPHARLPHPAHVLMQCPSTVTHGLPTSTTPPRSTSPKPTTSTSASSMTTGPQSSHPIYRGKTFPNSAPYSPTPPVP